MDTSDITGTLSRIDQWLGERLDGVFEWKQRLEATYCEKRARRAEARNDLEAAEKYYDRARELRGRLGDRETTKDLSMRHATLAHENGNLGAARKQFQRVVELNAREENAEGALDALEPLLEILKEQGEDDGLREWWGHALMVLGKAEPGEIAEERRDRLIDQYAEQIHTEDSAGRIYGFALNRLLDTAEQNPMSDWTWPGDDEAADDDAADGVKLLDAAWERRDVVRESVGQFLVVLAAGVARVAHAELAGRDVDREETLEYVAEHRDRISEAATALFDRLYEGETDADPEEFRADIDPDDEVELREIEGEVFGRFLEELE